MYELEEHTADLEVRVRAGSFEELLRESVRAVTEFVSEGARCEREFRVRLKGSEEEKLMQLLEEVVYLQSAELFYVADLRLEGDEAVLCGSRARARDEIKAVTWHEFWLRRNGGWEAHFICDL